MMSNRHNTRLSPGRKTILSIAVTATLANGMAAAVPGDQTISAPTERVNWTDGNLTVLPGGSITSSSSALGVTVIGPQLGVLSNSGTISADSHAIANQQNAVTRIDNIINTSAGVIEANNYYSSAIVLNSLISSVGSIDNSGRINGNASGIDNNTSITMVGTIGEHGPGVAPIG